MRAWRSLTISIASAPDSASSAAMPAFSSTSLACSRAIGSSSTISTTMLPGCTSSALCVSCARLRSESASVTVTVKTEPLPFSLCT